MEYEMMKVDMGDLLPKEIKVPKDVSNYAAIVLKRFYEPNNNSVPIREINSRSKQGEFRSPEFCYGCTLPDYEGAIIIGNVPKLDRVLDFMAGYDISRVQGRELVKLLIAKRFTESNSDEGRSNEEQKVLNELEKAVDLAWRATIH